MKVLLFSVLVTFQTHEFLTFLVCFYSLQFNVSDVFLFLSVLCLVNWSLFKLTPLFL